MFKKLSTAYLLVIAVVGFTVSAVYGLTQLSQYRSTFEQEYKINLWLVAQAELELQRLVQSLDRYMSDVDPVSSDDLVMRLDVFWSRLPTLLSGKESDSLREVEGFEPTIVAIQKSLEAVEPQLLDLDPADAGTYRLIRDELVAHLGPLHEAVIDTMAHDSGKLALQRDELRRSFWQIALSFACALLAGVVFIVFLLREIRRTSYLLTAAEEARTDASKARAQLAEAIDSISEGFVLYDSNQTLLIVNQKIREIYSAVADLMVPGADFKRIGNEAIRRGQYAALPAESNVVDGVLDYAAEGELELELADGRWIRMTRRQTADGGSVSVHSDITELKNRERELAVKSQELQTTLDNIIQGICVFDRQQQLTTRNDRFLKLLGLPPELGDRRRPLVDILQFQAERGDFGGAEASRATVEALVDAGGSDRLEFTLPTGQAIEMHRSAMPDGGLVATFTDITERRQAEKKHQALMDGIHQSQKMQAVGTLAGGIAHDFNNILASILGNVELALDDLQENDPAYESVVQIQRAGQRATKVVEQILAFSRHQPVEAKPFRLDAVVQEGLKLLRATLPSTIELVETYRCDNPTLVGDATQLHQVLMNLGVNAGHAIGTAPGSIHVGIEEIEVDGGFAKDFAAEKKDATGQPVRILSSPDGRGATVWVALLAAGPHLKLTVRDTGCGMSYQTMSRMFEPFFTTKGVGAGTGLGLAAVHGIVTKHRGAIVVDSREGEGTTFTLLIPRAATASAAANEAAGSARLARQGGSERILLVDDEQQLLEAARRTLQRAGFEVDGMTSSLAALEAFRANPHRWRLVVTDQTMPKMTGATMAEEMLRLRPDLAIILCTGYSATVDEQRARAIGIREFALKPIVGRVLTDLVRRVIDASTPTRVTAA